MHAEVISVNLKSKDHLGDLSVYGRIILKWILRGLDSTGSG